MTYPSMTADHCHGALMLGNATAAEQIQAARYWSELEKDAERYRWFVTSNYGDEDGTVKTTDTSKDEWDEIIDKAMNAALSQSNGAD